MTDERKAISIDDLNDKLAGRLAREAELARIREAQARVDHAPPPPPRAPSRAGYRSRPHARRRVPGISG